MRLWLPCLLLLGACDVYDSSLLSGGAAPTGGNTTQGGNNEGGNGASTPCMSPSECPGVDSECGTRTCEAGVCGITQIPAGTEIAAQIAGDCKKSVCDGAGSISDEPDAADVENDNKPCTTDSCVAGAPQHDPTAANTSCTGGNVCDGAGNCVECTSGGQCPSGICTDTNTCAPASCGDNTKNGSESDIDCGGQCTGCLVGQDCVSNTDCLSLLCTGTTCQESCFDGTQNQDETDVDCGGSCGACAVGDSCSTPGDCVSGVCGTGTCGEYKLLISEARSRGPGGGADDFVEIYNPLTVPVTLPMDLEIATRSDSAANYGAKFAGMLAGLTIPAHGHLLLAGGGFTGTADLKEANPATGIVTDKASIVVRRGATVIDALCMHCGADPFNATYSCEGTPKAYSGCTTNSDRSFERAPGGAAGNGTDTNNNSADFTEITPAAPQSLASAPTP